jgi:DNA-binding NarL/FixJ family response regulator
MHNSPVSVLLVDERCAAIRDGLRMRLELEQDIRIVGEATTAAEAAALACEVAADVVLLSIPNLDDLNTPRALVAAAPNSLLLVLTPRKIRRAREMEARATGIAQLVSMHDGPDALVDAICGSR